jgi:ParB family chromosome partitioning protein
MAPTLRNVRTELCDYPSQPRSNPDPEHCRGLGDSMKAHGQWVPIIGHTDPKTGRFIVADGGCRLQGAILRNIPELLAMDLGKAPTPLELKQAQAAIDIHKQHFKPMERGRLWYSIKQERGCTNRELAKELGVSDSLVGDYLSLVTLPPEVQELVNSGALHLSKASLISQQESAPDRQRELAALAKDISREELATKVKQSRRNGKAATVRVERIKCPIAGGAVVQISGEGMNLDEAIAAAQEWTKQAKKASQEGLDAKTFERVCRDKAKAGG